MSEIFPIRDFRLLYNLGFGISRINVPRMHRKFSFVLKLGLVVDFNYSNSIFHLLRSP